MISQITVIVGFPERIKIVCPTCKFSYTESSLRVNLIKREEKSFEGMIVDTCKNCSGLIKKTVKVNVQIETL